MAEERMKHAPVRLSQKMIDVVVDTIGKCAAESPWRVYAASVEDTHTHLLISYSVSISTTPSNGSAIKRPKRFIV